MRKTVKQRVLEYLQSNEGWHGCNDLIQFGTAYRNRIADLQREGKHLIESRKQKGKPTYEYKYIGKVVKAVGVTPPPIEPMPFDSGEWIESFNNLRVQKQLFDKPLLHDN